MTERTPQVVTSYLARLDEALVGIPDDVRSAIVAGVREEVAGLDAAQAASRLDTLGDPMFIAAEAHAVADDPPVEHRQPQDHPHHEPTWLWLLAGVLVMIGGLIVPIVGSIAGIVLVWISSAWTRRQKITATVLPLLVAIIVGATAALASAWSTGFNGSGSHGIVNPLMPAAFDSITLAFAGGFAALFIEGIWLLVRAHKRSGRDTR